MTATILVVDDEPSIRRALERLLVDDGYRVLAAGTAEEALQVSENEVIDAALIDLVMPGQGGIELVRALKYRDADVAAIVMTGFGTITTAVDAMKEGAFHYLTKPFELEDIRQLLATALKHRSLAQDNRTLRRQLTKKYQFANMIGQSPAMQDVFELIRKVADTDSTALLLGESGTGKELVARALHYNSHRAERPLITVNCGAIPAELLEAELFGYVRGAFTGAVCTRPGKFEAAHGGTIFLDEIGELPSTLQVKLLRVIQERKFERIGSTRTEEVDVRIVAATNRDLEADVRAGKFREDLYYRLNVIPMQMPALRERAGDVALLAHFFLDKYSRENGRTFKGFAPDAMQAMEHHPWPGNVRELENVVERMVVLKSGGTIEAVDLPPLFHESAVEPFQAPRVDIPEAGLSLKDAVTDFENGLIRRALQKSGGNKNKAAGLLKLNRTTLVEKIKKQREYFRAVAN